MRRFTFKGNVYYFKDELDTIYVQVKNMFNGYDKLSSVVEDVETVMDEAPDLAEDTYTTAMRVINQYIEWASDVHKTASQLVSTVNDVRNGNKSARRLRRSRKADVTVTGVDDLTKQITGGAILTTNTQAATAAANKLAQTYKTMLQAANDLLKAGVPAEVVAQAINAQVQTDFKV